MVRKGLRGGQFRGLLTRDEVSKIHATTLMVLAEIGLVSWSDRILRVFESGGAEVNEKERRIRIPESLVKEALKKAPSSYVVYARNPKYDFVLEKNLVYYGTGGAPCSYVLDLDTGKYRRSTKKDFADAVRLGDALENISYISSLGGAHDVSYEVEYEHEWEILFNNTEKHVLHWAPSGYLARKLLMMAETVVGGVDELKKRPIITLGAEFVSPLVIPKEVEGVIDFALAGVPVYSAPVPQGGATAPATLAGTYVVGNAETLAMLTLVQLVNPGAPFLFNVHTPFLDPLGPHRAQTHPESLAGEFLLNAQIAAYYDLPCRVLVDRGAKVPDAQAGAEVFGGALMAAMAGVNMVGGVGWLDSSNAMSLELIVICDEIIGHISEMLGKVKVDEETLAFDVIKEVGPGGSFLSHKHTLKHIGELYTARHRGGIFFDATPEATWMKTGGKDAWTRMREKAKKILMEHQPEPLPKHIQERLADIVKEADKEKVKS